MGEGKEREFLLSVFLMEAWDTFAAVEHGLTTLASGAETDGDTLRVVTHRLRGSASLNGFPRVSALATVVESAVERALSTALADRQGAVTQLGELVLILKEALETIGTTGVENAATLDGALARYDTSAPAAAAPPGAPVPAAPAAEPPGPLAELDRFLRDNPDVLEYFIPEATEHLELMAQSLQGLEQGGVNDAEIATLFRAIHTLKGAAYTVGCQTIGALAHRIEDLLGEVRENTRTLTPTTLEAVYVALDALRLMVRSAEGVPAERRDVFVRATRLIEEQFEAAPTAPVDDVAAAAPVPPRPRWRPGSRHRSGLAAAAPKGRGGARTYRTRGCPGGRGREGAGSGGRQVRPGAGAVRPQHPCQPRAPRFPHEPGR